MIRVARANPHGYKRIKPAMKQKNLARQQSMQAGSADQSALFKMYGEPKNVDLVKWGVDPEGMPNVGQKPDTEASDGRFP